MGKPPTVVWDSLLRLCGTASYGYVGQPAMVMWEEEAWEGVVPSGHVTLLLTPPPDGGSTTYDAIRVDVGKGCCDV